MEIPENAARETKNGRNYGLTKSDGTQTRTPLERQRRWTGWVEQQYRLTQEKEKPKK